MSYRLPHLSSAEADLILQIIETLSEGRDQQALRKGIAQKLLALFKADYFASYVWNGKQERFETPVFLNMSWENLSRYETYFQFCDPITPALQKRRTATRVCEIMPQHDLEKTEFFNDFLKVDGLHHGINLYAYDGDLNIGDLRIWRSKHTPAFTQRDTRMLNTLLPHFRNALRNAETVAASKSRLDLWQHLLDHSQCGLFLFNDLERLVYRNRVGKDLEKRLPKEACEGFYGQVKRLKNGTCSQTEWGPFSLSVLKLTSPHDCLPHTAVLVREEKAKTVNTKLVKKKYGLSPREAEIAILVCKGLTDPEISSVLGIAFSTVRTHVKKVFLKLDVTTRSEMVHALLEDIVEFSF